MDEEIERLVIGVRADTGGFARDVAAMKATLEEGVGSGAMRAGLSIESALGRATRTGKLGFDDLRAVALRSLEQIAAAAVKGGVTSAAGGSGGLATLAGGFLSAALGLPGRATGGPVSPGAAYVVGERGPELFVPTSSGSVAPMAAGGAREVKVSIAVSAAAGESPRALERSSRQVARAVTQALRQAEG
jgi:phage-related minor tail protein